MKKNDHSLTKKQREHVQMHAHRLLQKAEAYDRFPTPIGDLVTSAELEIGQEQILDSSFLGRFYQSIRDPARAISFKVKKALDKVQGLLWRSERTILLDPTLHPKRKTFLTLHEIAHDYLPAQRKTFAVLEDSDAEIDPETKDLFEREANSFASELLFQLDRFEKEAADCDFGFKVPLNLSKRYGASVYASARRYVQRNRLPCALLVFNMPVITSEGTTLEMRRVLQSPSFTKRFGEYQWSEVYGPESYFVQRLPRRQFGQRSQCRLQDLNKDRVECLVDVFNSTRQVFFLICVADAVTPRIALAS